MNNYESYDQDERDEVLFLMNKLRKFFDSQKIDGAHRPTICMTYLACWSLAHGLSKDAMLLIFEECLNRSHNAIKDIENGKF